MSFSTFRCQSCGAPLEIDTSFARVICCEYCSAICKIEGNSLAVVGNSTKILVGNSFLKLNNRGQLSGRSFRVLGRVRYHHEVGVWDEWQLEMAGSIAWLQEDEGELTLFETERVLSAAPPLSGLKVSEAVSIEGMPMFVAEKGEAVVAALVGQIPRDVAIGQGFYYVDGYSQQQILSLEYYFSEVSLSIGRSITRSEIVLDT